MAESEMSMLVDLDGWRLFFRHEAGEWVNMKLIAPLGAGPGRRRVPKLNFWFGWNGNRFSRSKDVAILVEKHPHKLREVEAWLRAHRS